ncbi:MAG: hypothetical protein J5674_06465 [Candidatus Methanomethylophilaceae archaeon]|nr:hypothetical protein [Candidatus Methanomethylophilaceae archaeon]
MPVMSFDDVRKYRRCPRSYRLSVVSDDWRLSLHECLDLSLRRTIARADGRRVLGHQVGKEEAEAMFRDEWDDCVQDAFVGEGQDPSDFFRRGMRCVSQFIEFVRGSDGSELISFDVRGVQNLPYGRSVRIRVDEVYRRGDSAVVCRYVTDPSETFKPGPMDEHEALVSALWAVYSLPGIDRVVLQWRYLHTGEERECRVRKPSMDEAAESLSKEIGDIESDKEFFPKPSDLCGTCPHRALCPSYMSSVSSSVPDRREVDELVAQYADLDEKIVALSSRVEMLKSRRESVKEKIVAYSDSTRCDSVFGDGYVADIRRYKRAELPKDKSAVISRLKETRQYDSISMVNYSRLRSDIVRGIADPEIAKMATITEDVRVRVRRISRRFNGNPVAKKRKRISIG